MCVVCIVCIQGILFAQPETVRYPIELVYLWLHECSRVYSDKLMEEKDVELFSKILLDTGKRYFEVRGTPYSVEFINAKIYYGHGILNLRLFFMWCCFDSVLDLYAVHRFKYLCLFIGN